MTTYNSREFPHPILKPERSDYQPKNTFTVKTEIRKMPEDREIALGIKYILTSKSLLELIEDKRAAYLVLIHCIATRTRESRQGQETTQKIDLKDAEYHGKVGLQPMIIATKDLTGLKSGDWNPDITRILPDGINIPTGAILAIADQEVFNLDDKPEVASFIDLVPSDSVKTGNFKINLEGPRITIQINPQDSPKINGIRTDHNQRQNLYPSIYMSAVDKAIRNYQREEHQDKRWAQKIAEKLEDHEIDQDEQILQENSLEYAQVIMESPLERIIQQNDHEAEE